MWRTKKICLIYLLSSVIFSCSIVEPFCIILYNLKVVRIKNVYTRLLKMCADKTPHYFKIAIVFWMLDINMREYSVNELWSIEDVGPSFILNYFIVIVSSMLNQAILIMRFVFKWWFEKVFSSQQCKLN